MKKLIAVAAMMSLAVAGWAQGTIDFRNRGVTFLTDQDRLVYADEVGGQGLWNDGTQFVAALFFAPGADQGEGGLQQAGNASPFRSDDRAVGTWSNATSGGNTRVLEGVAAGQTATVQVRVWNLDDGATFDEARGAGGLFGASEAWNYTVPSPGSPPDQFYLNGLNAFALVPEPSVIALGVLGAASLLLFRRRK